MMRKQPKSKQRSERGMSSLDEALLRERLKLMTAAPEFKEAREQVRKHNLYVYDTLDMKAGETRKYILEGEPVSTLWAADRTVTVTKTQAQAYEALEASGVYDRLAARYGLSPNTVRHALLHRGPLPSHFIHPAQDMRGYLVPQVSVWAGEGPARVVVGRDMLPSWKALQNALAKAGFPEDVITRVAVLLDGSVAAQPATAGLSEDFVAATAAILTEMEPWLSEPHVHVFYDDATSSSGEQLPELWIRLEIPPQTPAEEVKRFYRLLDEKRRAIYDLVGQPLPRQRRASPVMEKASAILLELGRLPPRKLLEELAKTTDYKPVEDDRREAKRHARQRSRIKKKQPPNRV